MRGERVKIKTPFKSYIDTIIRMCESRKAVLSVITTLLVYKIYDPYQDIRLHRADLPGGFSGRGIDTRYVTPFLKSKGFPAAAESGWLTRSFEHPSPYDIKYPGKISPQSLKEAFLKTIDSVQAGELDPHTALVYLLQELIEQREGKHIRLPRPVNLTIEEVVDLLERHFTYHYASRGASRLPVLATYALYQLLLEETGKYEGKILKELLPHQASDERSGRLGDIQIETSEGNAFEVIEIKDRPIDYNTVLSVYNKIQRQPPNNYYILTTSSYSIDDRTKEIVKKTRSTYGTHIIINGVIPTIKYYLRLVRDVSLFVNKYVDLLKRDESVSREHKEVWIELCSQ
ncbi:MAG: hypothetical protein N3D14_02035 [Aquificaceae bacterium]|nr:hypothetical protein [Aquificaceae bacterium]